ncbi:MAG: DnaJ domain-containing protein, partial [Methanosarcinales archaeon]|nr:DnaJ domain-containing protein [Methanosarcinales archaeon]
MADKRDYYDILGVEKSIPGDELKKAYRKLAL